MIFSTGSSLPTESKEPKRSLPGRLTFCLEARPSGARFASISGAMPRARNPVAEFALVDKATGVEYYKVHKIQGDGKCMFRATVRSLAMNKGTFLNKEDEREEADGLRIACHKALCMSKERRKDFPDATKQIMFGYGELTDYCRNLAKPAFWGGEVEMMVLAKMLQIPFIVYRSREELGKGEGYEQYATYGDKYRKPKDKTKKPRRPVRLLYTGGNHYDLLI